MLVRPPPHHPTLHACPLLTTEPSRLHCLLPADPSAPVLMIGSHYDTVHDGGKYDGALGIIVGISAVKAVLLEVGGWVGGCARPLARWGAAQLLLPPGLGWLARLQSTDCGLCSAHARWPVHHLISLPLPAQPSQMTMCTGCAEQGAGDCRGGGAGCRASGPRQQHRPLRAAVRPAAGGAAHRHPRRGAGIRRRGGSEVRSGWRVGWLAKGAERAAAGWAAVGVGTCRARQGLVKLCNPA